LGDFVSLHPNANAAASLVQTLQRAWGVSNMTTIIRIAIAFTLFALVATPVLTQAARIVA
jgi:hypothetical protein